MNKLLRIIIIIALILLVAETINNTTNSTGSGFTAADFFNIVFAGPFGIIVNALSGLTGSSLNLGEGLANIAELAGNVLEYIVDILKEAGTIIINGLKTIFDSIVSFSNIIVSVFLTMGLYIALLNKYGYDIMIFFTQYSTLILSIMIVTTLTASMNKAIRTRDYEPLVKWATMWVNFFKSFVKIVITLIEWIIKIITIIKDYVMSMVKSLAGMVAGGG